MATYFMFGKYSNESIKEIARSEIKGLTSSLKVRGQD